MAGQWNSEKRAVPAVLQTEDKDVTDSCSSKTMVTTVGRFSVAHNKSETLRPTTGNGADERPD